MSLAVESAAKTSRVSGYFRNPWRKPRFLQATTILYLLWSLLPVVIAVIFSLNGGRSRSAWQGFSLAVVDLGPDRLPAARCGDPHRDAADVPALDRHRADRGPAGDPVRHRHRPLARPTRAGGQLHDAAVLRGAGDHPRRVVVHPVHEPVRQRDPAGHQGAAAGADRVPDQLSGHHRARAAALDRPRVRGGRDGPRRDAQQRDPSRVCCRCSPPRSSRASRWCSPTPSTTS